MQQQTEGLLAASEVRLEGGVHRASSNSRPTPALKGSIPRQRKAAQKHSARLLLTMSAVLPLTLRLRLKRGKSLHAPSTTVVEHTRAVAAPTNPSTVAALTAEAWFLTAAHQWGRR